MRDAPLTAPRGVSILGSTGSIGEQALDVARLHPGDLRVVALAAGRRVERLIGQALEFRPELVCVARARGWCPGRPACWSAPSSRPLRWC